MVRVFSKVSKPHIVISELEHAPLLLIKKNPVDDYKSCMRFSSIALAS